MDCRAEFAWRMRRIQRTAAFEASLNPSHSSLISRDHRVASWAAAGQKAGAVALEIRFEGGSSRIG